MVAQKQKGVDNGSVQITGLAERVAILEARLESEPSLGEVQAVLSELTETKLPAVNKAIGDLQHDGQAISTRVTQLEKLPAEINEKVSALDTRLQNVESPAEVAAATAATKLAAYKGYSEVEMQAAVKAEQPIVLVEIAKRLKPKVEADRKVLEKMVDAVADKDGVLTAELITYAGTKV